MKISHSIIVLTSIIFVTGSMITVGMDLKRTTNNVTTNVVEAKRKHNQEKNVYLQDIKKYREMNGVSVEEYESDLQKDKLNRQKTAYKLKSLNQQNNARSANKFL